MKQDQVRVTQTIDRLISNLPNAIAKLKEIKLTSMARQIQNDLNNLKYWQSRGGLSTTAPYDYREEKDFCACDQINWAQEQEMPQPTVVCLCGSTRFYEEFQQANFDETMKGNIVLSVGFYPHSSDQAHGQEIGITPEQKEALDILHFRKIDIADEVLVLNVGGYIGESTARELAYAKAMGKHIRFLDGELRKDGVPCPHQLLDQDSLTEAE